MYEPFRESTVIISFEMKFWQYTNKKHLSLYKLSYFQI